MYQAHHSGVLAYALRRLPSREDAEDVVSETFQIAWRRLDEIPRRPRAWLLGVGRNRIAERYRLHAHEKTLLARATNQAARRSMPPPNEDELQSLEQRTVEVLRGLAALDELDREAIMLVAWDELSYREAARVLDISSPTFAVRLHRARKRLAECLSEDAPLENEAERTLPAAEENR